MAAFHSSLECAALSNPGLVIVYEYALERSKSFVSYKLTPASYFFVGGGVGAPPNPSAGSVVLGPMSLEPNGKSPAKENPSGQMPANPCRFQSSEI